MSDPRRPQWIVPLTPDPDGPRIIVEVVNDQYDICVYQYMGIGGLPVMPLLVARLLGQALQDAAAWAGRGRPGRGERGK